MSDGFKCKLCGWEWKAVAVPEGDSYLGWIYLKAELDMSQEHMKDHLFDDIRAGRVALVKREGEWEMCENEDADEESLFAFYYKEKTTGEIVHDLYHYVETGAGEPYDGKPPKGQPRLINLGISPNAF